MNHRMHHQLEKTTLGLYRCTVCLWAWTCRPNPQANCPLVPRYKTTSDTLRTATQWARVKRQPKSNEKHNGVFWSGFDYTPLWTIKQTELMAVLPPMTPTERAERRARSRTHRTCGDCHKVKPIKEMDSYQLCNECRDNRQATSQAAARAFHTIWLAEQRSLAGQWAADLLRQPAETWAILDTETTDMDGAIIEIAIIDGSGTVLLNTRLQPNMTISAGARAVHGITNAELKDKPTFAQVYEHLAAVLRDRDVIIYNARFDTMRLAYECDRYNLPSIIPRSVQCAMERYSEWYGAYSIYHASFTWQPLNGGHTALGDCLAVRERLVTMSQTAPAERIPEDPHPF